VAQGKIKWLTEAMASLGIFYEWRGRYQEGEAAFRLAAEQLAAPRTDEEARFLVRALTWQACFNNTLGRSELVAHLLQRSSSSLDSAELANQDIRVEKAFVLKAKGFCEPSFEKARGFVEQSLVLYQALGDHWETAEALHYLSTLDWLLGNYDQSKQLGAESLAMRRALADKRGIAASLSRLGGILKEQGELEQAERLLRESLAQLRDLGDQSSNVTNCLYQLAITLQNAGKFAEARAPMKECFQIHRNLGSRRGAAEAYEERGHIEILAGEYQQGRAFIESILPILEELNMSLRLGLGYCDLGMVALAEKAYAEARQLLEISVAILREVKVQFVLSQTLVCLALAERGVNNVLQAQQRLAEAIQIAAEIDAELPLWDVMPAAALLMLDHGKDERAVELYALASRNPYIANCRWFADVAGNRISAAAAALPSDVATIARERGKALDLRDTATELLLLFEGEPLDR
jgi:tetratricopeptide (TPR) repeat protein